MGGVHYIKIQTEQNNQSPDVTELQSYKIETWYIDNLSAQKGAKHVKKLPKRQRNFPGGGIFEG